MGANAQTAVPVFTAGQVLTAVQQTEINTGIPVFATTVTRDAAFGGAGEKALAEGQFAYIEATNTTQYYDGAAWQSVGTSGLTFITGASFSAVTSVSLPTNTFTSTYRNYKIIIGFSSSSATQTISGRLRSAGADITTANYWQGSPGLNTSNVTVNLADDTQTSWKLGNAGTVNVWGLTLDAIAPNISNNSKIFVGNLLYYNPGTAVNNGTSMNLLSYNGTPFQVDSLSIIASTGNFTGTYRIYGYSES